jgi:hypothetical protein
MIKRYRSLVFSSLLIPTLGIVLINVLYLVILRNEAIHGRWIEEPIAKAYLLSTAENAEYIFIGSSRTQNHINSLMLSRMGVKVLNLGMAGREWEYYPYIIKRTKAARARSLVISMPADVLFGPVSCPDSYFYQLQLDTLGGTEIGCFFVSDLTWDRLLDELPMNRFRTALEQLPPESERARQLKMLEDTYGYDAAADGRQVNYVREKPDRSVLLYANGDGQVFCHRVRDSHGNVRKTNDRSRRAFDLEAIEYLAKLARLAQQGGKNVIYIIEPAQVGIVDLIDMDKLRSALPENVWVFNNAAREYARGLWADKAHFNLKGSELYTAQVYDQIKQTQVPQHSD